MNQNHLVFREFLKLPLHLFSSSRSPQVPSPTSTFCFSSISTPRGLSSSYVSMDRINGYGKNIDTLPGGVRSPAPPPPNRLHEDGGSTVVDSDFNGTPVPSPPYLEAELCAEGRTCVTTEELGSVAALAEWLKDRLPLGNRQLSEWGRAPGTKRVANLWLELSRGEISLEDSSPPIRTVHVACVRITDGAGRILIEACQEFEDGSIRERNRPLSEKMKPGESVEAACLRGIVEELGPNLGAPNMVKIMRDAYRREMQQRESFSYPGLMTCYVLHHMEAIMEHLPADAFVTEENELSGNMETNGSVRDHDEDCSSLEESAVGVKKHFWKWIPEPS